MSLPVTHYETLTTPVGDLLIAVRNDKLVHVGFAEERHPHQRKGTWLADASKTVKERTQLSEYFAGVRQQFDLELLPVGTDFQRQVWSELRRIPYAETISYGELARRIGNPKAMRAVGLANGRNPIPIVVPCHRVIGANGSLTGFGGGVERKRWLLDHEQTHAKFALKATVKD